MKYGYGAKIKMFLPLKTFKKDLVYSMSYSGERKQRLDEMFGVYGNTMVGKMKVIFKVMKWKNLVHYPQTSNTVSLQSLVDVC
jgi:hypothetical protein